MTAPYDDDLAFIHASGFGELAAAAVSALVPELKQRGARRVVDVGCGAGVSTKALLEAGFETLAIEPSSALLEIARRSAPSARYQRGSAYDLALGPCDAILALGEVLTYHPPTEDAAARVRKFFAQAGRALSKNGLLVFDLIETSSDPLNARSWTAGPDWAVLSASREDVATGRLTREIQTFRDVGGGNYRRSSELHHVRLFERSSVVSWLEQAGFEVEVATAYGAFRLGPRRVAFRAFRL
jgi:SAM-dependent methyltransferase